MANLNKNAEGYGYKYTDLAAINTYIESIGETYYQFVETDSNGNDYIYTVRCMGDKERTIRGCRIVADAMKHSVQGYGSGLSYARRYSLLMAYGLATEEDDGKTLVEESKPKKEEPKKEEPKKNTVKVEKTKPVQEEEPLLTEGHMGEILQLLAVNGINYDQVFTLPISEVKDKYYDGMLKKLLKYIEDVKDLPEAMR